MASVSSTSSLGNTSLRGYGGMASGIDRDAIIEQMTAGTNTKIWNQESAITKLEWKQEAYRSISDKILDLYDNFASYTSVTSLKDPNTFAKSLISVLGKEESTRFVTASGASELVGNVLVQAVRQLASSSVRMSEKRQDKALTMALKELGGKAGAYSNLSGAQLKFVDENGEKAGTFEFANSYVDEKGVTHKIDYFPEDEEGYEQLAKDLNELLKQSSIHFGDPEDDKTSIGKAFQFEYNKTNGTMELKSLNGIGNYKIQGDSTALAGLGYKGSKTNKDTIDLATYNANLGSFEKSVTTRINTIDYLRNEKLSFNYDGSVKDIMLITNEEAKELLNLGLSDDKLRELLGTKNADGTWTPITQAELESKKEEIINALRSQEKEAAEKDADKNIRADVLAKAQEEFLEELRDEVKAENPDLAGKPDDDKDLIAAMNKKLEDKGGLAAAFQDKLVKEAEANGHDAATVEAEIRAELRKEAEEELGDTEFPTEELKEEEINRIINAKLDKKGIEDRVKERQAELALEDRVTTAKDELVDDGKGGKIKRIDAEIEKALQARVDKCLADKSMTARLTEDATSEQQDAISKELNQQRLEMIKDNVQKRLDKAVGNGNIEVGIEGESLTYKTKKKDSSISVSSNDGGVLYTLGITNGESNKVNLNGTLKQSSLGINISDEKYSDGLVINGVKIDGINANTSISSILSKINSSDAGVKATYVAATGQFMLVSEETGSGRDISLDSALARELFGRSDVEENSTIESMGLWDQEGDSGTFTIGGQSIAVGKEDKISDVLEKIKNAGITHNGEAVTAEFDEESRSFVLKAGDKDVTKDLSSGMSDEAKAFFTDRNESYLVKGQDAIIDVSYGNGVTVSMERASNTFDLEGMTVTVSGIFGGEYVEGADGKEVWKADTSAGVSFSAKADVDKVTEKVKKFFEDFNAIVTEVNKQVTTRPDSSYGPLTDAQKDEMNETSIENWENKAKSGLLFNDSVMRDLSMDIQAVYTKMMKQTGLSYEDLKELGISYSDNEKDGGVLVFDENAFRSAMENKPEKVSALFTGGSGMGNGLVKVVEETFTPYATRYATRNGNSYGRLIEEAGSEKIPTSIMKNQIYNEIKSKQDLIEQLRAKLKTEQDRYISMFTTMETMINKMNSQASYLSQITG